MSGASYNEQCRAVSPELAQARLLTEVNNLRVHLDPQGNVSSKIETDTLTNLGTAIAEISMPYAVTTTTHDVEYMTDEGGVRRRAITWLGKHAVPLAMEGHSFHFSEPAHARVDVEVAEAKHDEETLAVGTTHVFISPKMSCKDATEETAKAEHLFADDSIRTSRLLTNQAGEAVGREMKSLLVRGIPLSAWVAMLKDPGNIFGKAIQLRDEESALSVMEVFAELELPDEKAPEGPVTLVEEVLKYISDQATQVVVREQLVRFRDNQDKYKREAKAKAKEWYAFELELARSFESDGQRITSPIRQFMLGKLQHRWTNDELAVIASCQIADEENNGRYKMTEELAAILENAMRKILGKHAAVLTGNEQAMKGLSELERRRILSHHRKIEQAVMAGANQAEISRMIAERNSMMIHANVKVGGGCAGSVTESRMSSFQQLGPAIRLSAIGEVVSTEGTQSTEEAGDSDTWTWTIGVCQVKACPSPKPTEVGPCSVCRHCQAEFDKGIDPTISASAPVRSTETVEKSGKLTLGALFGMEQSKPKTGWFEQLRTAA